LSQRQWGTYLPETGRKSIAHLDGPKRKQGKNESGSNCHHQAKKDPSERQAISEEETMGVRRIWREKKKQTNVGKGRKEEKSNHKKDHGGLAKRRHSLRRGNKQRNR